MTNTPLVSVVTPVHNLERELRDCIESVLAQTYTTWDYTIVNNCSTDGTLAVAMEYAARDSRIRVVNNERFLPVIASHNAAFREISPESAYCKVVGADDELFPDCLWVMVRIAEANPGVAIVGSPSRFGTQICFTSPYPGERMSGREIGRLSMLGGAYVFGTPTSVLYRSDIVRGRHSFYNEANIHADTEACYEFLQQNDFGFSHEVLSCQAVRAGSETSASRALNTYIGGRFHEVVTYGSAYLSAEEKEERIRVLLGEYHQFLHDEMFKRAPKFWRYHRARLAEAGYPLTNLQFAGLATRFIFDRCFRHPIRTARNILRRCMA